MADSQQPAQPPKNIEPPGWVESINVCDIILFTFGFLVLGAALTFGGLYIQTSNTIRELKLQALSVSTCPDDAQCIGSASRMLNYMEGDVSPCDDFYQYSCNGYRTINYTPDLLTGVTSVPSQLDDQRKNLLMQILSQPLLSQNSKTFNFIRSDPAFASIYAKIQTYFKTCRANVGSNVLGYITDPETLEAQQSQDNVTLANTMSYITNYISQNVLNLNEGSYFLSNLHVNVLKLSPNTLAQVRGLDSSGIGIFQTGFFDVVVYPSYTPSLQPVIGIVPPILQFSLSSPANIQTFKDGVYFYVQNYIRPGSSSVQQNATMDAIVKVALLINDIRSTRPKSLPSGWVPKSVNDLDSQYKGAVGNTGSQQDGWYKLFTLLEFEATFLTSSRASKAKLPIFVSNETYLTQLGEMFQTLSNTEIKAYEAYSALVEMAALSTMHGTTLPKLVFPSVPTGFNIFGNTTRGIGLNTRSHLHGGDKMDSYKVATGAVKQEPSLLDMELSPKHAEFISMLQEHNYDHYRVSSLFTAKKQTLLQPIKSKAALESVTDNICLQDAMEKFPIALARLYALNVAPENVRNEVKRFTRIVKQQVQSRLDKAEWLSATTLALAQAKLSKMDIVVGLPDMFLDTSNINAAYQDFTSATLNVTSAFPNNLAATININFVQYRQWSQSYADLTLQLTQDWTEVNAYFVPQYNKLILPMGFLHPDIYSLKNPMSYTYGTVGVIVAHEMFHAYDHTGITYNEYGQALEGSILDKAGADKYFQVSDCLVQRLNSLPVSGFLARNAFDEMAADNGALAAAFAAYQADTSKYIVRLPGITNFDDNKFFWLGFGQMWCSVQDPFLELYQHINDVHPISSVRVNGGVSLMNEFSKTFQCNPNDKMYVASNCKLFRRSIK